MIDASDWYGEMKNARISMKDLRAFFRGSAGTADMAYVAQQRQRRAMRKLLDVNDLVAVTVLEIARHDHHEVIECPESKTAECDELCDAAADLANVKAVYAKNAEEETKQRCCPVFLVRYAADLGA